MEQIQETGRPDMVHAMSGVLTYLRERYGVGIAKTTLDRMIRAGTFPKPAVRIGHRIQYWLVSDVDAFMRSKSRGEQ